MPDLVIVPDKDEEEQTTVVLVPDGTLLFSRMIVDIDDGHLTGFEHVWMKPGEDGVWRAKGPKSGHLYVHSGWYHGMIERRQAFIESLQEQQREEERDEQLAEMKNYWAGLQEGSKLSNRIRAWFWVVLGHFLKIGHQRGEPQK